MSALDTIRTRLEDLKGSHGEPGYRLAIEDVIDLLIRRPTYLCFYDPAQIMNPEALSKGLRECTLNPSDAPKDAVAFKSVPSDTFKSVLLYDLQEILKPKED